MILLFTKDQKPKAEDTMKIRIHSRFLPTPIIPPNLTSRVWGPTCHSETVCSTTLSKVTPRPDFTLVA